VRSVVILNGGKAAMKDRTRTDIIDAVNKNYIEPRSVDIFTQFGETLF
jgi:hypothetical protein